MTNGILAGYPIVDIKVKLYDGSYHEVDSSEMAFKIAGSMGFKEGFAKASPVLLEPIMKVEIVTPEDYLGDVMGDVSRRRGILQGQDDSPTGKIRSEEHTSELQSLMRISYAVFCLKKKKKSQTSIKAHNYK